MLEHLEDPLLFLKNINLMMKKNGLGLISAAINAPNADHIYLYSYLDVKKQLVDAGFKIIDFINDKAYEERTKNELVPVNSLYSNKINILNETKKIKKSNQKKKKY